MKDAPEEAKINVADWEDVPYMWVIYPKYSTVLGRMSTAVYGRPVVELI